MQLRFAQWAMANPEQTILLDAICRRYGQDPGYYLETWGKLGYAYIVAIAGADNEKKEYDKLKKNMK